MKKISVLIPVIRPQNIQRLTELIYKNSGLPSSFVEIVTLEDKDRAGCPVTLKRLVSMATHSLIAFIGDDTEPQPGFLLEAWKKIKRFPEKCGLVGFNDEFHDGNDLATHFLAHKKLLAKLDGEFFHTGYRHTWCDVELNERCKSMGRYAWAKKAVVRHNHPIVRNDIKLVDEDYKRVYSDEWTEHDRELYKSRKFNGWKTPGKVDPKAPRMNVAIGIPAGGEGKAKFWMNLENLMFHAFNNGINVYRKRRMGSVVLHNRNLIVSDILSHKVKFSHLLFIDDDMTFPPDLLHRLLAHNKDIVVTNAHRKYPPYIPVVSRTVSDDDIFHPVYIRPEKGRLEEVTSAGTGVCLVKMDVFRKIPFPWFHTEYLPAPEGKEGDPGLIEGHLFVSEDNRFFLMARHHGFKIYCDFSIEIGHIGNHEVTWRDHEREIENYERDTVNHAQPGSGDRRDGNLHDGQSGAFGRVPAPAGDAQFPVHGSVDHGNGGDGRHDIRAAV
jgi:hypothetical protein